MSAIHDAARFELTEHTLTVTGDISADDEPAFEEALRRLFATRGVVLRIDLSAVRYVASIYVRHIAFAMMEAKRANVKLVVVAGRRVMRLLKLGGLDKLGHLEAAREDG
jgi:anti-anti-sigma factor